MKRMKKLFAILMTMAMVMGLGITGFAADSSATITVSNLDAGATIKYLQVVEPDTSSPIGWKFSGDDGTIANVFKTAFNVTSDEDALTELINIAKNSNQNGDASTGELTSSRDLSEALTTLKSGNKVNNSEGVSGNTITVSKAGLYVIVAITNNGEYGYVPMLAYVADNGEGNLEDATVVAKGSHNVITKELTDPNGQSVYAGDEVPYKATVEYPYYSEDTDPKTFWVEDTLTNAKFKSGSVVVKVKNGAELVANTDYQVNDYADTDTLSITFNYDLSKAGSTIEITYVAIVGEETDGVSNKINTNFDKGGDTVKVDQVEVAIKKIENVDGREEGLKDAIFTLYNVLTQDAYDKLKEDEKREYEQVTDATLVSENASLTNQTVYVKELKDSLPTNEDGETSITGLDAQVTTYYIKETTAPSGYTLNENYYQLTGAEKDAANSKRNEYVYSNFGEITVEDTKVSALPETGGMGTTIFTIAGCVIMISAAGLFFASRRKAN